MRVRDRDLTHAELDAEDEIAEAYAESQHLLDLERRLHLTPTDILAEVMADGMIPYSQKPSEYRRRLAGRPKGD